MISLSTCQQNTSAQPAIWNISSVAQKQIVIPARFDVRDGPISGARVYSDQTLFDEPTRAVMKVLCAAKQERKEKRIGDGGMSNSSSNSPMRKKRRRGVLYRGRE